ncbi:MAG: sulfite exporter TauE/SafE family protein [Candidatus Nanopelagicales bacterium]|jgi:uncharacterized membrane protein YfcA
MTIALLISVALLAGIFAGLTGAGGGLILVPLLVFMGYSALESVATSNIAVMISAISATVMNSRDHDLPWRRILLLALPALILAPVGAIIASRTPEIALLIAFCALNIVNIYLLGKRSRLADTTDATDVGNVATKVVAVGGSGGLLAGLFGVGGGLVMVPLQVQWLATPIQAAARISLAVIIFSSIGAIFGHGVAGDNALFWTTGLILGIGGVVGAPIGARILSRISQRTSTIIFQLTLVAVTISLLVKIFTH